MSQQSPWQSHYWAQGYALIPKVFSAEEMNELGKYFDEILKLGEGLEKTTKQGLAEFRVIPIDGKPTLKFAKWASSIHEGLNKFRSSPLLYQFVTELFGPNLRQITNQMHYKNPGDGVSFQMHQDCTFRKPDSSYRNLFSGFAQVAIAVDAATDENGCLQLVPTSHLEKKQLLEGGYEGWEANGSNQKVLDRLPKPILALMDPGDLLIWNPYTIHGSKPNRSTKSRRVYINGFARAEDCDNGILVAKDGKPLPLQWGPETLWDVVEER